MWQTHCKARRRLHLFCLIGFLLALLIPLVSLHIITSPGKAGKAVEYAESFGSLGQDYDWPQTLTIASSRGGLKQEAADLWWPHRWLWSWASIVAPWSTPENHVINGSLPSLVTTPTEIPKTNASWKHTTASWLGMIWQSIDRHYFWRKPYQKKNIYIYISSQCTSTINRGFNDQSLPKSAWTASGETLGSLESP